MVIQPMIRSNMCVNAHPKGCATDVRNQIAYVQKKRAERGAPKDAPKTVLVLGCSTGYGLASRINAAFGFGAATIGVSFEKEGSDEPNLKSGTPGWYNNMAFDKYAKDAGLEAVTYNGDAFSHEMRRNVIETLKKMDRKVDLLVYSVASAVRVDPDNGTLYRSVLKPIGKPFSGETIDCMTGKISTISAEPATEEEAANTVKVMGGEDWALWVRQLKDAGVLANGVKTVAYSYIGPALSHAIYRDGTIGGAKKHLEATARELNAELERDLKGEAYVSVNKGLVTRSSAVIPIIPLYLSVLFKVMKEQGTHEGCIEQMERLMNERLYTGSAVPTDENHLIRIDDWELDPKVQEEVNRRMATITQENFAQVGDLDGYRHDFLATNGFDIEGVDYTAEVNSMTTI
ncbi:enoyl-ACP reductase FabV [uncultured Fibrobacter sp.]|uniref:enoyl-ACP reductase FabV n=1 Tax=uncultured Fibrobacter sp. TaxID=261512 RepID=UPI0026324589|nr:enoyl-ACP reductase FabV [uncultured Fibrobacter sp.]